MFHSAASDLGLHCLHMSLLWDTRHKWIKVLIITIADIFFFFFVFLGNLFVLRFYGPVNPMGSCRARSVYLTTRLLGRLSPLSG